MVDLWYTSPLSPLRGVEVELPALDLPPLRRRVDLGDDRSLSFVTTWIRLFVAPEGTGSLPVLGLLRVSFSCTRFRSKDASGFGSRD